MKIFVKRYRQMARNVIICIYNLIKEGVVIGKSMKARKLVISICIYENDTVYLKFGLF